MILIFFPSLTRPPTEEKDKEDIVPNITPILKESENNVHNTVNQQLNDIVDEDIVQNNAFVSNIPRDPSVDSLDETTMQNNMISIAQINSEHCGVPLSIFDNVLINNFKEFYIFLWKYLIIKSSTFAG